MHSEQFRTGKPPVFAAGNELQGNVSNQDLHRTPRFCDDR